MVCVCVCEDELHLNWAPLQRAFRALQTAQVQKKLALTNLSITAHKNELNLNFIFITLLYLQLKAFYHIKLAFRVKLAAITPLKF